MTELDAAGVMTVLARLPGHVVALGRDLPVAEFYAARGTAGRWLFVRFHRDGSVAVVCFDPDPAPTARDG